MSKVQLKDFLHVEVSGRIVKVEIRVPDGSEDMLKVINVFVDENLKDLMLEEMVRKYYNRVDRFIVFPERDCQPVELKIAFERLLKLS